MKEKLNEYVGFIRKFESLLKIRYNIERNPCQAAGVLFDRAGTINGIKYRFHGTGCTIEKDNVFYRYDISIFEKDEIQFSLWKFSEFIRTHAVYGNYGYTEELIENELQKLIDEGVLAWLTISDHIYKIYRVL